MQYFFFFKISFVSLDDHVYVIGGGFTEHPTQVEEFHVGNNSW